MQENNTAHSKEERVMVNEKRSDAREEKEQSAEYLWLTQDCYTNEVSQRCNAAHIVKRMGCGETPAGNECDVAYAHCGEIRPMYTYGREPYPRIGRKPDELPVCGACIAASQTIAP